MNFLKVCFSLCHSFRSTGQYERVKGLTRYFQGIHQGSWRQQDVDHAFMDAIDRSKVIDAIFQRVQNHWGERAAKHTLQHENKLFCVCYFLVLLIF